MTVWGKDFMVGYLFKNVVDGCQWAFARVYGPNLDRTQNLLWDELAGLSSIQDLPWCIGNDFKLTPFSSKRSGGSSFNHIL